MKSLTLLFLLGFFFLFGCNGNNENSENSTSATSSMVQGVFSDSQVINFSYTTGSANLLLLKNNVKSIAELILPSSYAISNNYSCYYNYDVSFSLQTQSRTITKTTNCSTPEEIERVLRKALIPTLLGHNYSKSVSVNGDTGVTISLPSNVAFGTANAFVYKTIGINSCYASYTFYNDGRLKINRSRMFTQMILDDAVLASVCPDGPSMEWATYQMKNGSLEIDLSSSDDFDPLSQYYERWDAL